MFEAIFNEELAHPDGLAFIFCDLNAETKHIEILHDHLSRQTWFDIQLQMEVEGFQSHWLECVTPQSCCSAAQTTHMLITIVDLQVRLRSERFSK